MNKDIKEKIIEALSEYLGLEPQDISEEDSLYHDLHMKASDLADFLESLKSQEIDIDTIDLSEIETVGDLIEASEGESDDHESQEDEFV